MHLMSSPPARALAALSVAVAIAVAGAAQAALPPGALGEHDPALQPAELKPLAAQALLLDLVRTPAGLFAVGERGILVHSSDEGGTWVQRPLPTRQTITAIASAAGELWVGGHGGLIFRSSDNGDTWTRQRIDLWSADAVGPTSGAPILDLHFLDAQNGFAIGAFSLMLRTRDGGVSWETVTLPKPEPDAPVEEDRGDGLDWTFSADDLELDGAVDPHLNAIASTPDGALFIAGERGAMFRSLDGGEQWERLDFPYDGSMFGLLTWGPGHVLAYGLRGHAFESLDAGATWSQLDTGTEGALQGGVALERGGLVLVGNEGLVLRRDDAASALRRDIHQTERGETPMLTSVLPLDGRLLLIGEKGVVGHDF